MFYTSTILCLWIKKNNKHLSEEKARLVHIEYSRFIFLDKIWNPFHPRLHKAIVNIPPLTILYQPFVLVLLSFSVSKNVQLYFY